MCGERVKREGFGPWEAQDTWDDKGKPYMDGATFKKVAETIENVVKVVANASLLTERVVEELAEAVTHPIDTMSHSKLGLIVLAFGALFLFVAGISVVRMAWPIIYYVFCWPVIQIVKFFYGKACCMVCLAAPPFISARNWYIRRKKRLEMEKYDAGMEVLESSGEIPLKRIYTKLQYDENGAYVAADDFTRVYLNDEVDQIKAHLIKAPKRINGDLNNKETMIVKSVPRTTDKLPDFQGVFKIDDTVIGHYSCIRYKEETCLLTAYHVLDYNRNSLIKVCKGKFEVELSQVRAEILACSVTEQLDFVVLRVPLALLSKLQLKIGKTADRLAMGSAIAIYQIMDNKPVYTRAIPTKHDKPWHIKYPASTIVGSSGAPILDIHQRIVGVHVESSPDGLFNVGVVPPFLRKYGKESPTNSDVLASAEAFKEEDLEQYYREKYEFLDDEFEEDYTYVEYVPKSKEELRLMGWAEQMDEHAKYLEAKRNQEEFEFELSHGMDEGRGTDHKLYVLRLKTESAKKNIQQRIKGNRYRKESPWSCSKCGLLHLKAGYNCVHCGFALRKAYKDENIQEIRKDVEKSTQESLKGNLPPELVENIVKRVLDDLTKRYNFESIISESLNKNPCSWKKPVETRKQEGKALEEKAKNLPPKVAITKQLAQALDTKKVQPYTTAVKTSSEDKNALLVAKSIRTGPFGCPAKDAYATKVEKQDVQLDKSVKETVVPDGAKRRTRHKKRENPAVPLNSKAPLRGGATVANGSKVQNPSRANLQQ